jgi:hypothetical protein
MPTSGIDRIGVNNDRGALPVRNALGIISPWYGLDWWLFEKRRWSRRPLRQQTCSFQAECSLVDTVDHNAILVNIARELRSHQSLVSIDHIISQALCGK